MQLKTHCTPCAQKSIGMLVSHVKAQEIVGTPTGWLGTGSGDHYESGLFTGGVSRISGISKSLNSLESLENGRTLLYFQQSGGSLKSLEPLKYLESLEDGLFWKNPFPKDSFSESENPIYFCCQVYQRVSSLLFFWSLPERGKLHANFGGSHLAVELINGYPYIVQIDHVTLPLCQGATWVHALVFYSLIFVHLYIYIYICNVVFNFGAFFLPMGSRMRRFFRAHGRMKMTKKNRFPPVKGKQFSAQVHRNVHSGANIQCVQKLGAYVAQHKHPNIERVRAGRSWTLLFPLFSRPIRRRTNVQQLTCKIDLPNSFYYLFFSFVLLELKPFVLKGKVLGEKLWKSVKKCEKVWKSVKNYETILPFSCCPLVFPWPIPHNLKIPKTPIFAAFRDDFVGVLAPPPPNRAPESFLVTRGQLQKNVS